MSKKYVSECLGNGSAGKDISSKLGTYLNNGKVTFKEYREYLSNYSISSTRAIKFLQERKITLEDYLRYYIHSWDNIAHKDGSIPSSKQELKSWYINNTTDKARLSSKKFKEFLLTGDFDVGNITPDLQKNLAWYEYIFNDPELILNNMDKKYYELTSNFYKLSYSRDMTEECFLKLYKKFNERELVNTLFHVNNFSEDFILKNEKLFVKGKKKIDFVWAIDEYDKCYRKSTRIFSEEFLLNATIFAHSKEIPVHLRPRRPMYRYSWGTLEKLGYIGYSKK